MINDHLHDMRCESFPIPLKSNHVIIAPITPLLRITDRDAAQRLSVQCGYSTSRAFCLSDEGAIVSKVTIWNVFSISRNTVSSFIKDSRAIDLSPTLKIKGPNLEEQKISSQKNGSSNQRLRTLSQI